MEAYVDTIESPNHPVASRFLLSHGVSLSTLRETCGGRLGRQNVDVRDPIVDERKAFSLELMAHRVYRSGSCVPYQTYMWNMYHI